jgi:hypothetical protein
LSNVNCTGQESYLGKCGNVRWGSVDRCKSDTDPAVYCYQKEGKLFNIPSSIIIDMLNSVYIKEDERINSFLA